MTLAEQLRNEINVTNEIPWLAEEVVKAIRNNGRYVIICDTHIKDVKRNWSLPNKYFTPVCEWARKEGFCARATYNSYGVKHIEITL